VKQKSIKSDLKRIDALTDDSINYTDIAELDDQFFKEAKIVMPPGKKQLTIRLDKDMLEWMQSQGRGYQSRINAILRAYYEAHKS
jgi:uncharacterized protein (DUF4415 family)